MSFATKRVTFATTESSDNIRTRTVASSRRMATPHTKKTNINKQPRLIESGAVVYNLKLKLTRDVGTRIILVVID